MDTILEDTKTNSIYCMVMFVVFAVWSVFGGFTGIGADLMAFVCAVFAVGAVAFMLLHISAAKSARMYWHKG